MLSDRLYQIWLQQLQAWAADGRLLKAAITALRLNANRHHRQLTKLVDQLAAGDGRALLPPIELLPGSSMPGAAGAYASSSQTIYLNNDWVDANSDSDIIKVLTEELGHHFDALIHSTDSKGDEGKDFTELLTKRGRIGSK